MGPRKSAAWGRAWARHGATQGRGVGLRRGATALGCAGAQQRWVAQGRSVGLRGGAARGWAGAQRGAGQGRSVGPRRGAAALGCAGAQQRLAALGRSSAWLRMGVARG